MKTFNLIDVVFLCAIIINIEIGGIMEYKTVELNCDVAVGKSFEFPTSDIQSVNYGNYYYQVCHDLNPIRSYGIYEVGEETTKFTVAVHTELETNLESFHIPGGTYYEFELDMMENQQENQYVKCFARLEADELAFETNYSFEVMDRSFNPMEGKFKYKYYIRKK